MDTLRGEVALVTRASRLRRDAAGQPPAGPAVGERCGSDRGPRRVGGCAGVGREGLPRGLSTTVGSGGHLLSEPQSPQLALAGSSLPTRTPWCWTRRPRCFDPARARHLERSLASVVADRTVVAIAHRLHTARCRPGGGRRRRPDQQARLLPELLAARVHAALWRSWRAEADALNGRLGRPRHSLKAGCFAGWAQAERMVRPARSWIQVTRVGPQRHRLLGLRGDRRRQVDAEVGRRPNRR